MISNAANIQEIDIDSLFDDPKSMVTDLQASDFTVQVQDDINKVLNDALAQIDENQRITLDEDDQFNELYLTNTHISTITDHENDSREENSLIKTEDVESLAFKPLSPASLLSDNSQISSPKEMLTELHLPPQSKRDASEFATIETSKHLKRTFLDTDYKAKYQELLSANKKLKLENTDHANALENKAKVLARSIEELKRSEIERIQLMKENRELKQVVQKFVLNDF